MLQALPSVPKAKWGHPGSRVRVEGSSFSSAEGQTKPPPLQVQGLWGRQGGLGSGSDFQSWPWVLTLHNPHSSLR